MNPDHRKIIARLDLLLSEAQDVAGKLITVEEADKNSIAYRIADEAWVDIEHIRSRIRRRR